jgi:hypothetical protein
VDESKGVDEEVLEKVCQEYKTPELISKIQLYDNYERQIIFYGVDSSFASSIMPQNITAAKNILLINAILNDSIYDFDRNKSVKFNSSEHKEYIPLKMLLSGMDKIYYGDNSGLVKLKEYCGLISEYIRSGKLTLESSGLVYLTNNNLGDCNDLTPAYFALLTYYGFKVDMPLSVVDVNSDISLHTWLNVKMDDLEFDLDPTWYRIFVPLDPRLDK